MNAQDRKRQPKGVTIGGQYAHEARTEAHLELSADNDTLPSEQESVAAIAAHLSSIATPEAAQDMAQRAVDDACDAAGPDVPREWVGAVVAHDASVGDRASTLGGLPYRTPGAGEVLRGAYEAGMPADWAAIVGEEYGPQWVPGCVKRYAEGLTATELARLDDAGLAGTPTKALAYVGCDTDEVSRWHAAAERDTELAHYLRYYLGDQGIGRYIRRCVPLDDVKLCHELGVEPSVALHGLRRPDGSVEMGPAAIRELADYAKACGQSTDEAHAGIRLGVPASEVKAFGPKVEVREIAEFKSAGVPPKVARSLRGRDGRVTPQQAAELHAAGISTGADYKAWMSVAATRRDVVDTEDAQGYTGAIALARAGVPLQVAQKMRDRGLPLASIKELHAAGVDDIEPWAAALHGQTQTTAQWSNRLTTGLHFVAEFAKAGGTPEVLRRLQRAGVPLTDSVEHMHDTPEQMWAAGEANRRGYREDTIRLRRQYGTLAGEPTPWDYDGPQDL